MNSLHWVVYGLIDSRTGSVFYIGITQNIHRRIGAHHCQEQSSAYAMCRDIAASGAIAVRCVFGEFEHKRMAEFLERQLIVCIPQTFNRTYVYDGLKFWEPLATELGYRR